MQVAALAALTAEGVTSDASMVHVMRWRIVDWLRERDGRRVDRRTVELDCEPLVEDEPALSVRFGFEGRFAVVADMAGEGFAQRDIAARLGVSESRVSQLLVSMRRML